MGRFISIGIAAIALGWLRHWGGAGLIALGIIDSSVIPIPGGLDLMTVLLAASNKNLWLYYALMSTAGSVAGGYLTYRVARKGGKETLDQRIPRDKLKRVEGMFERWGFGTVFIAAISPPPFPTVPFLAGAGALNYPVKKFIVALTLARATRFAVVAYLASLYGRSAARLLSRLHLSLPVVLSIIAVLIAGGLCAFLIWRYRRRSRA